VQKRPSSWTPTTSSPERSSRPAASSAATTRWASSPAPQLFVAKGKKLTEFSPKTADTDEIVAAMLGPTGNLRAPTIRCGETVLVGFNLGAYERVLG
jgi:hypothetical protein